MQPIEGEPRRKRSKTGSSAEQVERFLFNTNACDDTQECVSHTLLLSYCNENKQREFEKMAQEERETEGSSGCDASSLP